MLELSDSQTGVTVSSPSGPSRTRSAPHSSDASCAPYVRRIGTGDVDALADMTDLATELDEAISHAITGPRAAGYSWAEIAVGLGVTRQAAQQRWGQ
jgi:hypothetical protein